MGARFIPMNNSLTMKQTFFAVGVILFSALVCFVCGPARADAYTLTGFKFDHLNISYTCGSPELQQAVQAWAEVSALTDGGCSATPDITLTIVPDKDWEYGNAAGVAGGGHEWIKADYEHHFGVILHETGHTLGMGHSSETFAETNITLRNAAMFYYCCNPINEDDAAGIQALYGPPERESLRPRVYVPMISN